MPDENNPEITSFPDGTSIPTQPPTVEDLLRDPQHGITTLREFVEAASTAIAVFKENQRLAATAASDSQAKASEIANAATQAVAAMTQITDAQAVIATKSDHIQKAQEHADKVRADLDRVLTSATQQATETEGLKSRAQSSADTAANLVTEIRTTKASVEADSASIGKALKVAEASSEVTKGLAAKSNTVEERIADYEKRLEELEKQCAEQLKTIIGLLPGATSAGLASAWDKRRQTFLKPHGRWQWVFVGSVISLVALAVTGLWHVYHAGAAPTYDELLRLWLARLPVAGALVWLALYASRESALAKRLEEDYGYKSAIASCFEGFQKQMAEIEVGKSSESPLATLCENTLTTIATPPGRIYDGQKLTVSPTDELKEVAKVATDVASAVKPSPK